MSKRTQAYEAIKARLMDMKLDNPEEQDVRDYLVDTVIDDEIKAIEEEGE